MAEKSYAKKEFTKSVFWLKVAVNLLSLNKGTCISPWNKVAFNPLMPGSNKKVTHA